MVQATCELSLAERDLWLEEARTPAAGTFAGLRQAAVVEGEPAGAAARRQYCDAPPLSFSRPKRVPQLLFRVAAVKPELARKRRDRTRLISETFEQLAANGSHRTAVGNCGSKTRSVPFAPMIYCSPQFIRHGRCEGGDP